MGTAPGLVHLLELRDQKLMALACKVDTHFVWLEEIQEEARHMFTRKLVKEPELMPKTPSQKNRGKKRRIANIQDASRNPIQESPEENPSKEAEPMEEAGPEVPKNEESTLWPRGAPSIVVSMPGSQPAAGGQAKPWVGQQEAESHQTGGPEEPPQSVRRKHNCRRKLHNKEAVSELDQEQQLQEEELQLPPMETPSRPCPASKVVQPPWTFLHTMQKNQMLLTPTSASRSRVIQSFVKRNTPLRVDPKEKEQRRLENLRRKEAAEQLRRLRAEKRKRAEQEVAPQGKNEKAKEERLAEEKARKVAATMKMEVRRKQGAARRLRCLQQEEEEQQRKEEEEQERLQAERELREREKAPRLQKERLQRELEEKKKKSPACTSYQKTPQGPRTPPKVNLDSYGMDLNSDDSTDDESHPLSWATGTQLSQAVLHQYCHPPNLLELFGAIRQLDLEDIFQKSKPRYHTRTSSAAWSSPPLQGSRVPSGLTFSLEF